MIELVDWNDRYEDDDYVYEESDDSIETNDDELAHYGMPRRSGRYPWGSGEDPYQRTRDLIGRIEELKKQGWTETPENIEKEFGLTTNQYRAQKALGGDLRRMDQIARAESLRTDGLNNSEIGRKMGVNESTVRSLLDADRKARTMLAMNTADFIREQLETQKKPLDIGKEVNRELGVSREKMNEAVAILESEGYVVLGARVPQPTNPSQQTTIKVICPPGTPKKAAYDFENIGSLNEYASNDGGETFKKFVYPKSMDGKRLMVRLADEGGIDKDGLIELRPGVEDLSLGNSHYSQVRILVDDNKYLKGMAIYGDAKDFPDGVDVIFNTNKTTREKALKGIKEDPDNPFGSAIKPNGQSYYIDKDGKEQLSLINKRADEGDWSDWKDAIPSQFLAKQPLGLAKKQLGLSIADKKAEFDSIMEIDNPTIKKHFLTKFADECDSAAVHLQAAALPGQKYRVIIPMNSMKDNEVYAPTYEHGTKLALIRYPHGGQFEIPILTVNNKNALARKTLKPEVMDAVGINKKIAEQLSGADFDGDTVMCIPTNDKVTIKNKRPLKGLEGFDTIINYGPDKEWKDEDGNTHVSRGGREYRIMNNTQNEMGRISNLITDMTLKGANDDELAAAVRHSMVVIDAEKHKLDYKQSEQDNNIAHLKKTYQHYVDADGKEHFGGASTLISRSKGEATVLKRQGQPVINVPGAKMKVNGKMVDVYDPDRPEGSLIYKTTDNLDYTVAKVNSRSKDTPNSTVHYNKKGKAYIEFDDDPGNWVRLDNKTKLQEGDRTVSVRNTKQRTQPSTQMAETDDATTLISDYDTRMEHEYANYANRMKAMANTARKEYMATGNLKYNKDAKKEYAEEVESLMNKLNTASLNAPRERMAAIKTNAEIKAKLAENPNMSKEDQRKATQQAMTKYRTELGAVKRKDRSITITDREWEAIQKGAITESKLQSILNNADVDDLRSRATPRSKTQLSTAQISRIKSMQSRGYTTAEIAKKLGVSSSTVSNYAKGN